MSGPAASDAVNACVSMDDDVWSGCDAVDGVCDAADKWTVWPGPDALMVKLHVTPDGYNLSLMDLCRVYVEQLGWSGFETRFCQLNSDIESGDGKAVLEELLAAVDRRECSLHWDAAAGTLQCQFRVCGEQIQWQFRTACADDSPEQVRDSLLLPALRQLQLLRRRQRWLLQQVTARDRELLEHRRTGEQPVFRSLRTQPLTPERFQQHVDTHALTLQPVLTESALNSVVAAIPIRATGPVNGPDPLRSGSHADSPDLVDNGCNGYGSGSTSDVKLDLGLECGNNVIEKSSQRTSDAVVGGGSESGICGSSSIGGGAVAGSSSSIKAPRDSVEDVARKRQLLQQRLLQQAEADERRNRRLKKRLKL